jgi:enoyl-CoA hydratase/carnithine racemase
MARLDDYRDRYEFIALSRDDNGILTMRLHYRGDRFLWGFKQHDEVADCLLQISRDRENKVVILTGTGDVFLDEFEPLDDPEALFRPSFQEAVSNQMSIGRQLIQNHLDVEVPMIGLVNGAASWHAEIALLCDVVLCADHAWFQDFPHFPNGIVPGDGVHIVWPELLGMNRGRAFLLTGQKIDAQEALRLGLVAEVLPLDRLEPRGREIAQDIARRDHIFLRHTRALLVQKLRKEVAELLPLGLHAAYGAAMATAQVPLGDGSAGD